MSFDLGLSKLLMPVLTWLHSWMGSYPLAIIGLTLLVKLVLVPLDIKQKTSMGKVSALKPQMDAIAEKYKNDPDKQRQKQMELYKKEKVSPFSGCLPALLTMIPLFALLAVLNNAAGSELKRMYDLIAASDVQGLQNFLSGARFLWIKNIWMPDTFLGTSSAIIPTAFTYVQRFTQFASVGAEAFESIMVNHQGLSAEMATLLSSLTGPQASTNGLFILPLLSGGTQFLYSMYTQKTTNAPANDAAGGGTMGKLMVYGFPLLSVWICSSANAGFALYWTFSNIFMMITQFILNMTVFKKKEDKVA